jgi:outer membrane protein assembly factor BamB
MCHFLSHALDKIDRGAASRFGRGSKFSTPTAAATSNARHLYLTLLVVCIFLISSSSFAQLPFATSRGNSARDGANTNETLLTPANVNKNSFGKLFSVPIDYMVMAQPLYMPNVNIAGALHNVVYIVTQADSVYAFDADTGAQLWTVNFTNPAQGITTASGKYLPCGGGPGFNQEGIVGTPVIDPNTTPNPTMYLVAKTLLNGTTVQHHLHALDITTGAEQANSPVLIQATSVSARGHKTVFNSLHQKNRPGLLLLNGLLYMGFGSNYCNDGNSGWVLSYDPGTLMQKGVFNTSPDQGLTSIWQTGNGLAADEAGDIFVETAEAGNNGFDVQNGGQTYCNSVVKLAPDLSVADYFTPWSVAFLNSNDLDLSSTGVLILPDQTPGPSLYGHELIAGGKQGFVYVLDRDSMGMYSANDSRVLQEVPLIPGETNTLVQDVLYSSPAYWNNTVYFAPNASPILAFPLAGGLLGTPRTTVQSYPGSHSPSISSAPNNSNGILWVINGGLSAFDAVSLQLLYNTNQAANKRDTLPPIGHFVTQTVVNGRVYVGTQHSLEAYGLFHALNITGGSGQSAQVATPLAALIQVQAINPYTGQPDAGVTVNFSDGCTKAGATTCGSFNPPSAVSDFKGNVSTTYTVPRKAGTYTLTISGTMSGATVGNTTITAVAKAAPAIKIITYGGSKQTGSAGSILPNPLVIQAQDIYGNGVNGITVTFTANNGAIVGSPSVVTSGNGMAPTSLQLPTTVSTITITAQSAGLKNASFLAYSVAGSAANIAMTSGNNQSAPAGQQLPQALTVLVTDQYGNAVSGNNVTFSDGGSGGTFSNPNPGLTGSSGTLTQFYTLPPGAHGTIHVTAAAAGVANPVVFTESGQ